MDTKVKQTEHFGIDFGTTNIAVSRIILDSDTYKAFLNRYGEDGVPFPSILAVREENGSGKVRFGRKVKTQIATMQDEGYEIIKSIKTALGNEDIVYNVGSLRLTPTRVVGGLMKAIKRYLATVSQKQVEMQTATVAVPVGFSSAQRRELCKAFEKAGIQVKKIISESMAAYIRNRNEVAGLSTVMVFDWGGGTLDISLLKVEKGKVHEITTDGYPVAGDAIDNTIAEFVHTQLVKNPQMHINTAFKDLAVSDKTKLLTECEKAKIIFSDEDEIDSPAFISMVDYCGEKTAVYRLKYDDFRAKIEGIVSDAVALINTVLKKANMSLIDLDAIIMVGGSSNLLPLRQIMETQFRIKHNIKVVYPEKTQWSVAEGAAIVDSVECQYELNQDLNILMCDETAFPIIPRGSAIPFNGEAVTFGTVDNATSANFIISDSNDNILDRITMPAKGFLGEYFDVQGSIDNSLVAKIVFSGNRMMGSVKPQVVEINKLSYYCDISEIEKYQFEIKE